MIKPYFISIALCLITLGTVSAQVKIDDDISTTDRSPNKNAILDLSSVRRGLLFPRLSLASTISPAPLSQHEHGMVVYNLASQTDIVPGIYYNNGTKWIKVPERNGNDVTYNETTHILSFTTEEEEHVSVDLKAINAFTATNGIKKNNNDVQLGGPLTVPTHIGTSVANTLSIEGLTKEYSAKESAIMVMNETGTLQKANAVAPLFFLLSIDRTPLNRQPQWQRAAGGQSLRYLQNPIWYPHCQ